MKVTEVKYARKFNTGNYESEDYGITAMVEEDDKASEVFLELKQEIAAAHGGEKDDKDDADDTGSKPKHQDKNVEPDDEDGDQEVDGEDSDEDAQERDDDDSSEDADEEVSEVEEDVDDESEDEEPKKPAKAKKPAAKAPGKKSFKSKPQSYARDNDTHKEIFSGVLKAVAPNWKKDVASKKLAKDVSVKLEGTAFLDADGNVLAAFKQSVKKAMAATKK